MATYEQAIQALRAADAAGNIEDAKKLAQIASRLKGQRQNAPAQPQPQLGEKESTGKSLLIGAGRGFIDLGQGVKQLTLEGAEMLGLVPAGEAQKYTRQAQDERQLYEQSPVGQSTTGKVGEFVGGAAPFIVIPGAQGNILVRIATEAGIGAGIGATEFVPEGESRTAAVSRGVIGGAATTTGLTALAKLANTIRGRTTNAAAKEISDLGNELNIPTSYGDVTGKPIAQKTEVALEQVPIIGTSSFREKQGRAIAEATDKVLQDTKREMLSRDYLALDRVQSIAGGKDKRAKAAQSLLKDIEESGDDFNRIIQSSGNVKLLQSKITADKKFDRVRQLADQSGDINTAPIVQDFDKAIYEAKNSIKPNTAAISKLTEWRDALAERGSVKFSELDAFQSDLRDEISTFFTGENAAVGKKGVDIFQKAKNSVDKSLEEFATTKGDELKKVWKDADAYYKSAVVPYRNRQLAAALKDADADTIYGKFIGRGSKDKAQRFYNSLDDKGKAAVRYGIVRDAMEEATSAGREAKGIFSPAKFASRLEKLQEEVGVFFKGDEKRKIDGLTKLMRHVERAGQFAENPPTGQRIIPYLLTGAFAYDPITVGSGVVASKVLSEMLTTQAGKRLLLSAARLEPGSSAMNKVVSRLEDLVSRSGSVSASSTSQHQQSRQ